MRILKNRRRLSRCCSHRLSRRLVRRTTRRLGGRLPNYLAQACTAMRRSIRAHRKLIKLAPERFDHGVRERLAREQEEEDRRCAEYARAIARVYGTSEERGVEEMQRSLNNSRSGNGLGTVWFSARRERAIERWEAEWELWLTLGREAMDRHREAHPHRRLNLSTIARLLELGSTLGRLSTGLPV